MTKKEEEELLDKLRKEEMDYWDEQRKTAFPYRPQSINDDPDRKGEKGRTEPQK